MAQLVVRNLPDEVKERLRRRAKQHGHSLEAEVREVLERAVSAPEQPESEQEDWVTRFARDMAKYELTDDDWQEFERVLAENRKEWRGRPVDFGK